MNNNRISNTTATKLYIAHSIIKESKEQVTWQKIETEKINPPKAALVQTINRSYYYDSNGGGYQGF